MYVNTQQAPATALASDLVVLAGTGERDVNTQQAPATALASDLGVLAGTGERDQAGGELGRDLSRPADTAPPASGVYTERYA